MNRVAFFFSMCLALALAATGSALADTPSQGSAGSSGSSSSAASGNGSSSGNSTTMACIGDSAQKALTACPGGPQLKPTAQGKQPQLSFRGKVEDIKKGNKQIGVGTADVSMLAGIRDQRQSALKQRVLALLVTEIQQLESLYKSTDLRSKDRPMLLRRMAEDYVELENAAFREKTEAEVKRDNFKKSNTREAGRQQAIANSRKTAINYYTQLVTDYSGQPSDHFQSSPPPVYPQLDEVYYYLAYEYEQ